MATYGKKKKFMPSLNAFSTLRGSNATMEPKNEKDSRQGATLMATTTQYATRLRRASHRADWIEEDASMLLDDTSINHRGLSAMNIDDDGHDPQTSAMQSISQEASAITLGDGDSGGIRLSDTSTEYIHGQSKTSSKAGQHSRKRSAPPLPRRSSKRKSIYPRSSTKEQPITRRQISPPNPFASENMAPSSGSNIALDVQASVDRMLAHTAALKPNPQGGQLSDSHTKKRRLRDFNVVAKVKTALNDHLQARSAKKRHDPARDDRLLDSSSSSIPAPSTELSPSESTMTNVDIRLNEGNNLETKDKLAKLTGHGVVRRKPIANDGRSIKSRKSFTSLRGSDDMFTDAQQPSGGIRTTEAFYNRFHDDSSSAIRSNEDVPDVPPMPTYLLGEGSSPTKKKAYHVPQDKYFDALVSSSPIDHSTPRIRLEPSFERDGKAVLRNVRADSRSLFDQDASSVEVHSDMELDPPLIHEPRSADHAKRKSSPTKDTSLHVSAKRMRPIPSPNRGPWDMKKHPSPNRTFLQNLEQHIDNDPNFPKHPQWPKHDKSESTTSVNAKRVGGILVRKDINVKLSDSLSTSFREASRSEGMTKGKNESSKFLGAFMGRDQGNGRGMKTSATMTDMANKPSKLTRASRYFKSGDGSTKGNSKIRVEPRAIERTTTMNNLRESSRMDVDELQWDRTALMGGQEYRERNFELY